MQHQNPFPDSSSSKPKIAIGSCLLGEEVRYNGDKKRSNPHIEALLNHFQLIPICPEVGIGLGVPRTPIRLVDIDGELHAVDSPSKTEQFPIRDHTQALQNFADAQLHAHADLCGYILVKGSPSCGMEKVKRYNTRGNVIAHDAMGMYAQRLADVHPLLPLEEDGRLHDVGLRESFVSRVYLMHHWQHLLSDSINVDKLLRFYSCYKYKVMAHHVPTYRAIGKLLANPHAVPIAALAEKLIQLLMQALRRPATRASHTNTLQHIQGYLKNKINPKDKTELQRIIRQYHRGIVPLVVPMTLLQHHFSNHPDAYIQQQIFMAPHPDELALRSHLN